MLPPSLSAPATVHPVKQTPRRYAQVSFYMGCQNKCHRHMFYWNIDTGLKHAKFTILKETEQIFGS